MIPVLALIPLPPETGDALRGRARILRPDEPEAASAEAVITDGARGLSAAEIADLPRLSHVASASAGMEGIDREALARRGIVLSNVGPALAEEVADHAMMLLLAAWKGLLAGHEHVRSGAWSREGPTPLGRALGGRTLGILGLGGIGTAIARRAEPFGLRVLYHSRIPRPVRWGHVADPVQLARASDILAVAVPGGEATRGLVSDAVIDALGPEGVLVNVARGSVVDEPALIEALAAGRLGAAGLDVFASEPDPDPRLVGLPNVVLSPHAGSATQETRVAMARMVAENILAHAEGRPLPGAV